LATAGAATDVVAAVGAAWAGVGATVATSTGAVTAGVTGAAAAVFDAAGVFLTAGISIIDKLITRTRFGYIYMVSNMFILKSPPNKPDIINIWFAIFIIRKYAKNNFIHRYTSIYIDIPSFTYH